MSSTARFYLPIFARISSSRNKKNSLSPSLIDVPPYSGNKTLSPAATLMGIGFPSLFSLPGPTESTSPSLDLPIFDSGRRSPPGVYKIEICDDKDKQIKIRQSVADLGNRSNSLDEDAVAQRNKFSELSHSRRRQND